MVGVGSRISVLEFAFQRTIDQDGELAGRRGKGLWLPDARRPAAIERAECGLRAPEAHGGRAQDGGGAIRGRLRAGAEKPAAGDLVPGLRRWTREFESSVPGTQPEPSRTFMKKTDQPSDETMRPEYDFASMKGGVRGKYYKRFREGTNIVLLDPEVTEAFPSEASVNEALRGMLNTTRAVRSTGGLPNKALQPTSRARRKSKSPRPSRAARG